MKLKVISKVVNLIHQLRPLINRIRPRDKRLANQTVDAANSVVLNSGEAEYSDPGNRRARFHTAAGSAGEVRAVILRRIAYTLLSLYRSITLRGDDNRVMPWKRLLGLVHATLLTDAPLGLSPPAPVSLPRAA